MIDKKLHKKLTKQWAKVGRGIYQRWGRMYRVKFFLKFIELFRDKNVIELGCNAGIYGYEIAKVAKSYIGIDQGDYYIKQAKITQKEIKNPNVKFITKYVRSYIRDQQKKEASKRDKIDALFACFALYHFSEKEIVLIQDYLLPKCDAVIISTRTRKRTMWKKNNQRKFYKPKKVVDYLKESGFRCAVYPSKDKKFAIITGVKDVSDKGENNRNRASKNKAAPRRRTQGIKQNGVPKGRSVLSSKRKVVA
jgi:SAM-dependent methyltransferase